MVLGITMGDKSPPIYRHKKRGTLYRLIDDSVYLQLDGPHDMARMVLYQEINTEQQWTRLHSEFFDGRFERMEEVKDV